MFGLKKYFLVGSSSQIPLAQYRRRRHKQSGRTFCAVLNPATESDLVLVGGEIGGPQVLKLTQRRRFFTGRTHICPTHFGNMVFFGKAKLYSLCSPGNQDYQKIIHF